MSSEIRIQTTVGELLRREGGSIKTGPFGTALKASEYSLDGVPLISVREIGHGTFHIDSKTPRVCAKTTARLPEYLLEEGDIVFARKGGIERCALIKREQAGWFLGSDGIRLRAPQSCDARFLAYSFQTRAIKDWLIQHSTGSTMASLNQATIARLPIDLPSLREQSEISDILEAFDNRIALLRETNATLEAIAQALFKSWFFDFDPVLAKAEGRDPKGLSAELARLFPNEFEETEAGQIPKGWKIVPFGQLLEHTIGGDWGDEVANDKNDIRVRIIRGTDIPDLKNAQTHRVPIRYTSQKKLASRRLQDGDLVLEVSGGTKDQPTGRCLYLSNGILDQFDCPLEPASFCRLLRPVGREVGVLLGAHMTFIYNRGKTWDYQNQSTGISNFQTTHFLEKEQVVLPPTDVLRAFCEAVRPAIDRSHLAQIARLSEVRDTLLPRLISGQLRLPEAEALLRDAA